MPEQLARELWPERFLETYLRGRSRMTRATHREAVSQEMEIAGTSVRGRLFDG